MKLLYWHSTHGNFGDDLNPWFWKRLFPSLETMAPDVTLVGVGSILHESLESDLTKKLVIGSGAGYGPALNWQTNKALWDIRCVRGPKTAALLGLAPETAITDPAALIADFPEFQQVAKQYEYSYVPHWELACAGGWQEACHDAAIHYINPCHDAASVITQIAASEYIIAESLHGAILADVLRVPWVAAVSSPVINRFKWEDWTQSLNLTYTPVALSSVSLLSSAKKQPAQLSDNAVLQARKDALYRVIQSVQSDYC